MVLKLLILALTATALVHAQHDGKLAEAGLDSLIDGVLSKGAGGIDDVPKKCTSPNGLPGECVPYYLCKDGKINTDGSDLLDIRFNEDAPCVDYFEQCCETGDVIDKAHTTPIPHTTPSHIQEKPNEGGHGGIAIPPSQQKCGLRNAEGVGFRITGNNDNEAEYGEFPWMMAILKEETAGEQILNVYQCGGSLITPSVVLTGAHCVNGKIPNTLRVRAGEWDTQTKNEIFGHTDHVVQEVVVHEQFYKGGLHNDVALLFLETPVKPAEHINTVCLPPQGFNFDHKRCFVSGWGKDVFGKEGKYQAILKKIEIPTVPFGKCQESLRKTRLGRRFNLHSSFMCAGGEPGKDACKGDGGSPLVCPASDKPGHYYQAGIVAWGIGCGEDGTPGVYVDVAKFRQWIDQKLTSRNLPTASYVL